MENSILLTLPKWQLMRTWFLCKTMILSWRGRNFGWLLLLSKAGQNDFRPGSSSPVAGSKNIWTFCSLYKWIWTLANRYVSFSFNKWYWFFFLKTNQASKVILYNVVFARRNSNYYSWIYYNLLLTTWTLQNRTIRK